MPKSIISSKAAPPAIGPYSQGIKGNGQIIFTAGQIPIDPRSGQVLQGDVRQQTRLVLNNVKAILEEAGAHMEDVVKTTVFLKDMGEFGHMNEVYAEFFKVTPPARSTVEVSRLPRDVKIEIEAIAIVDR